MPLCVDREAKFEKLEQQSVVFTLTVHSFNPLAGRLKDQADFCRSFRCLGVHVEK